MYLQIDTTRFHDTPYKQDFIHFINISDNEETQKDLISFINHFKNFPGQSIKRVRKVKETLTNW